MREFELSGGPHRARRLTAYEQWDLLQTLTPAIGTLTGIAYGLRLPDLGLKGAADLLQPLAAMSEGDLANVIAATCGACERLQGETWQPVDETPRLSDLTTMVLVVVTENFGKLFALEHAKFDRTEAPYSYTAVSMPGGKDWLYRPVTRGCCGLESLHNNALQIWQIAEMNMALDVQDENEARARKAAEKR